MKMRLNILVDNYCLTTFYSKMNLKSSFSLNAIGFLLVGDSTWLFSFFFIFFFIFLYI